MPPAGKVYRFPGKYLFIVVVCTVFFIAMGSYSFYCAYWNVDGSFPHPVQDAEVFGGLWLVPILAGFWSIFKYTRHRLYISPDCVRLTGCFQTSEVHLPDVNRVVWKSVIARGGLVLFDTNGEVKISFKNYDLSDRQELVQFFHETLVGQTQEGWESFEPRFEMDFGADGWRG